MTNKVFVQCGVTAMREPNGKHLPSVPLYIEVANLTKAGLTELETQKIANISGFFATKRKEREIKQKKGVAENDNKIIPS